MKFKPSKYQQAVYDFVEHGKGNAVISAVAGSGKTTTIVNALELIPVRKRIIFCAFNNSIVDELKDRCPSYVDVTTMHSLGWRSMLWYYEKQCKLNPNKVFNTCEDVLWHIQKRERFYYFFVIQKLIDLYRQSLVQSKDELAELAYRHSLDLQGQEIQDAIKVFMVMLDNTREFDFTDMIYVPAVLDDLPLKKYDYVFVDECQDLNIAQQSIIKKIMKPDARLIAVGDPNQSIYGFAGADVESFNKLLSIPNTIELPLSVCYRCGKEIVKKAQQIVPHIEAFEGAPKGISRTGTIEEIEEGDWVLCRNVRPLVILCVHLIKNKKQAHVKGKDIGRSLINLLKQTNTRSYAVAFKKLKRKLEKVRKELKARGMESVEKHPKVVNLREKISVIDYLSEGDDSTVSIIKKLEEIFEEKEDGVLLSTIHKSKGLENDRVFLVCPELLPSRYAVQEWQLEQEANLEYVAYTRAKKELVIVHGFNIEEFEILDL